MHYCYRLQRPEAGEREAGPIAHDTQTNSLFSPLFLIIRFYLSRWTGSGFVRVVLWFVNGFDSWSIGSTKGSRVETNVGTDLSKGRCCVYANGRGRRGQKGMNNTYYVYREPVTSKCYLAIWKCMTGTMNERMNVRWDGDIRLRSQLALKLSGNRKRHNNNATD